jgi:hypothetical protein
MSEGAEGMQVGVYLKTYCQSSETQRASWRPRGAIWGGLLTVGPGCFNPGKETRYQMFRRLAGPPTERTVSPSGFEPRSFYLITSRRTDCAIPAGTDSVPHVIMYFSQSWKISVLCVVGSVYTYSLWTLFFNRVKWETWTYLKKCQWNIRKKKLTTYQSYGSRPETWIGVYKAFRLFKYLFQHVDTYIKLLLHLVAV